MLSDFFSNEPLLALSPTTARPSTVEIGTNVLIAPDVEDILERASVILSGKPSEKTLILEKWDGAAAVRVAEVLERGGEMGVARATPSSR